MDTLPPIIHFVEINMFGCLLKWMLLSYEESEFYMFLNIAVFEIASPPPKASKKIVPSAVSYSAEHYALYLSSQSFLCLMN